MCIPVLNAGQDTAHQGAWDGRCARFQLHRKGGGGWSGPWPLPGVQEMGVIPCLAELSGLQAKNAHRSRKDGLRKPKVRIKPAPLMRVGRMRCSRRTGSAWKSPLDLRLGISKPGITPHLSVPLSRKRVHTCRYGATQAEPSAVPPIDGAARVAMKRRRVPAGRSFHKAEV